MPAFLSASPIPGLTPEIAWLALSALLVCLQVFLQGTLLTRDLGTDYNAGPRDEPRTLGPLAGRADRALRNMLETFPVFAALALALVVAGKADAWSALGAALYFCARLVYVPLYLAGIPRVRSMVWLVSLAGISVMFLRLVL